jgi:hypothetical protein
MTEDRRSAAWLDAELVRREDAETRMAASLLDLERHPGHLLLSATAPTGLTARRWAGAQEALTGLWRDFAAYRSTLRAARAVRDRRARPGERELAELHALLVEPSIEVARTAVALGERGLTDPAERVETIALDGLGDRMDRAFREVSELVVAVEAAHAGYLAALVPVADRLREARRLVSELGIGAGDPDAVAVAALTDRLAELDRTAATDPLGHAGGAPADALEAILAETEAVAARLAGHVALRDRWDLDLGTVDRAVTDLAELRAEAERTWRRATELITGPVPPLPPDELARLRAARAGLARARGWAARATGLSALRADVDDAGARLRAAHELAVGLLERRDELRGRFGAFRARAARLGRAEDPQVLALDARIQRLLWTKPCDLAAATRELASYRRHLAGPMPGRSA